MGKASALIKKNAMKDAAKVLPRIVGQGAGAVGGMYLGSMIIEKAGATNAPARAKMVGPLILGLGAVGQIFLGNPMIASVAEGLTAAGAILTTGHTLLGKEHAKFGLASPEAIAAAATGGLGQADWDLLAAQSQAALNNNLNGWEDAAALMNGLGASTPMAIPGYQTGFEDMMISNGMGNADQEVLDVLG